MEKRTIVYLNSGFFDTDITVIKELTKSFQVHWGCNLNCVKACS